MFGQVFDQIFDQGFAQCLEDEKNNQYSVQSHPAHGKNLEPPSNKNVKHLENYNSRNPLKSLYNPVRRA